MNPQHHATSMLLTDVGDGLCSRQLSYVGDGFEMLMTDSLHYKSRQNNDFGTILKLSPS